MNSEQPLKKFHRSILSVELVHNILSGDKSASNKFVQINYKWLLFIIRNKFSQSNNHEDIVQDAFMVVLTNIQKGKIKNPKTISAYLRTTAINTGFEYLRKDKKFISALDQDFLDEIEVAQSDILSTLIWDDKINYVKRVIDELSVPRDKDILNQFYFKDIEKNTICQNLNLSTEHFDRVLYRAKERLKQLINHSSTPPNNPETNLQNVKGKAQNARTKNNIVIKINDLMNKMFNVIVIKINYMRFFA